MNNFWFVLIIKYRKEMILSHDDNFMVQFISVKNKKKIKKIYLLSFEISIYFIVKCNLSTWGIWVKIVIFIFNFYHLYACMAYIIINLRTFLEKVEAHASVQRRYKRVYGLSWSTCWWSSWSVPWACWRKISQSQTEL